MSVTARLCAVWLVTLIMAPWSAPFPVCDAPTFFDRTPQSASSTHGPLRPAAVIDDAAAHAVPAARTATRVQVMEAVDHPSLRLTLSISTRTLRLRAAVALANSPLVSPLRI